MLDDVGACRDLLVYAAWTAVAYAVCYALGKRFLPRAADPAVAGDAIFGLVYYPLLVVLAVAAACDLKADVASRWFETTPASASLGRLLVARMAVHVPYLYLKATPEEVALRPTYLVHHAVVIAAYGAGIFRDLAHFWGAAASLCEVTNVFLTVEECVLCAPNVYAPGLRRFLDLGFKATYVLFRLALFPALLWRQRVDLAAMPPTDRARLGFFELYFFPGAVLFVLALSCKWALDAAAPTKARRDSC